VRPTFPLAPATAARSSTRTLFSTWAGEAQPTHGVHFRVWHQCHLQQRAAAARSQQQRRRVRGQAIFVSRAAMAQRRQTGALCALVVLGACGCGSCWRAGACSGRGQRQQQQRDGRSGVVLVGGLWLCLQCPQASLHSLCQPVGQPQQQKQQRHSRAPAVFVCGVRAGGTDGGAPPMMLTRCCRRPPVCLLLQA
jgi:hypothetical protein